MKILAVETSSGAASAAVRCDGETVCEFILKTKRTHSETLMPIVEAVLRASGMTISDIGLLAAANGPGSFTGIRIGAAAVLGLAFGRQLPCVGVSTLYALAFNTEALAGEGDVISPVIDARHGNFYNALFAFREGRPVRLCPDRLISAKELAEELHHYQDRRIYIPGDGRRLFMDITQLKSEDIPERLVFQSASSVAAAAERIFSETEDKSVFSDTCFRPQYIRASQAERERMERLKTDISDPAFKKPDGRMI